MLPGARSTRCDDVVRLSRETSKGPVAEPLYQAEDPYGREREAEEQAP